MSRNRTATQAPGSAARSGCDLETSELVEYELVGAIEADLDEGRLSVDAPVGRALLGAVAGETVAAACPRGELRFQVISVVGGERSERKAA